ncbi:hypothetical protein [Candidatus Phycosocius spiralis]|nr:hypothetical protein [Candidatus Phycosocius spiralis]
MSASPSLAGIADVGTKAKAAEVPANVVAKSPPAQDEDLSKSVDVIIVWGFRVRSKLYEERNPPLREGYETLVKKPECVSSVCGYVVFYDGQKWRSTNVLAGDEERLRQLQKQLDYEHQTLVIVHPNGQNRTVPEF